MADDNMEISYDGNGDDDIDINIDIEPENQDEDFIIEDARSEAGTNNDDVMIDEDTASYPMEDADFVPEHDLHDVGTETHVVSEVEMLKSDSTDIHPFPSEVITNLGIQADERWDLDKPADDTHYSIKSVEIDRLHSEGRSNIVEEPVSQAQSPPGLDASIQKPSSPSKTAPEQEEESPQKSPSHMVDESNLGEEGDDAVDVSVHEVQTVYDLISQDRTIIALYKDTEYALVSSSEFDDPDSYFLKDSSVLKEPLSIFFAAIRDILRDEISPVDELYLAIDDLGLETGENSSSNNDLTFEQIVDLHTTLVHNDGETIMPPLYVTLGTRPEFAKSFGKLVEDAKQGKGLYEVVKSWSEDDELDVWAGSEGYVEEASPAADVTNEDNIEEAENKAEQNGAWAESGAFEDGAQQHVSLKASIDDDLVAISAGEHLDANKDVDRVGQNGSSDEPDVSWARGHDATTTELGGNGNHHDEVDEDSDLIDYEDEDYAQAGNGILAAPKQQKNINSNESAEYEAINENLSLSRRSSTRTIEDINGTEPTSHPEANESANRTVVEESYDDAKVHEYEGDEENVPLENGDGLYHVEDDANHYGEHNDPLATEEQYEQSDQVYDVHEVSTDLPGEQVGESLEKENEDEIGYEEEEEEEEEKEQGKKEGKKEEEEDSQPPKAGPIVSSRNAVMPAEESRQQPDEIDYEDDEEENSSENSELKTPAKQLATGKRPHQDETALDLDTPEAKRPRS